jgi:signal transduction histidine kinase
MSDHLWLDAAITAVSLFNALLLTWLGLTVLLNADRRPAWGIWVAGGSLLLGSIFFLSHAAIIDRGVLTASWSMVFWWTVGLFPAVMLPFAWYVVMLWYAGYWDDDRSTLYRRQRSWLWLTAGLLFLGLAGLVLGIFLLITPVTLFTWLRLFIRWSIAGIPLLAVGYSTYVLLCIGLSLDALLRPGPSRRVMGTAARQRARPWLVAVSVILLLVSLGVAGFMLWVVQDGRRRTFYEIFATMAEQIALFDLTVSLAVSLAILLLGQAVVSYEVFTGKTLPRRGLLRHWRRAVMLALGYAVLVAASTVLELRSIYTILLTTVLIAIFFALFSWQSYAERERYMEHLRPFMVSQRLYDQLLTSTTLPIPAYTPPEVDIRVPFYTLCRDILGAELAYLTPRGPLAPLVGPPLTFPQERSLSLPVLAEEAVQSTVACISLEPETAEGAVWAVPLWSERGLIGIFWLGPKQDGGLYTQEEIEIARASGERLIDTKASAEVGQRLMALQRERLAQSQIIDQQARRVLHDDILPTLQTTLILLNRATNNGQAVEQGGMKTAVSQLSQAHRQISDLLHNMPTTTVPEVARLGLLKALQRAVSQDLAEAFDEIVWQITPAAGQQLDQMATLTAEVLFYAAREAIRNAARYGRDTQSDLPFTLHIQATWQEQSGLQLTITDNGVGMEASPVATAEDVPRSGQGLALHSTMMAVIGGTLAVESIPRQYTRITLSLPAFANSV